MTIHANTREFWIREGLRFKPIGELYEYGAKRNPAEKKEGTQLLAGRLIVGFNVDGKPTWTINDLIPIVERVRNKQGHGAGSSYILQRGIFQETKSSPLDPEASAQIIIMNDDSVSEEKFFEEIEELGDVLRVELRQYSVLMDIQNRGVIIGSYTVKAAKDIEAGKAGR